MTTPSIPAAQPRCQKQPAVVHLLEEDLVARCSQGRQHAQRVIPAVAAISRALLRERDGHVARRDPPERQELAPPRRRQMRGYRVGHRHPPRGRPRPPAIGRSRGPHGVAARIVPGHIHVPRVVRRTRQSQVLRGEQPGVQRFPHEPRRRPASRSGGVAPVVDARRRVWGVLGAHVHDVQATCGVRKGLPTDHGTGHGLGRRPRGGADGEDAMEEHARRVPVTGSLEQPEGVGPAAPIGTISGMNPSGTPSSHSASRAAMGAGTAGDHPSPSKCALIRPSNRSHQKACAVPPDPATTTGCEPEPDCERFVASPHAPPVVWASATGAADRPASSETTASAAPTALRHGGRIVGRHLPRATLPPSRSPSPATRNPRHRYAYHPSVLTTRGATPTTGGREP